MDMAERGNRSSSIARPQIRPPTDSFDLYLRVWDWWSLHGVPARLATVPQWKALLVSCVLGASWAPATISNHATSLRAGFRFLGLIDHQGTVQPLVARVVAPNERRQALREALHDRFHAILPAPQSAATTSGELLDAIEREYGITGQRARRALRFFLHLMRYVEEPLAPALMVFASGMRTASLGEHGASRADRGEWALSLGQGQRWIGYYEARDVLARLCIPLPTFRLLAAEGVIPMVRFGERRHGTRYPIPAIEALAPVLDRFVQLTWPSFDRWWNTVGGRAVGEAPDYADALCFFRDPVVRAECVAEGAPPPDEEWPFQRLLADLKRTACTKYPSDPAVSVAPVAPPEEPLDEDAPSADWEAWVRRFREVLELAPSDGAWGYARGEARRRRAILRGDAFPDSEIVL